MRLRDFFRGPGNPERKSTVSLSASSLIPVLDIKTFVYAAQDKDTETLQKYLLAGFPPDQPEPATQSRALHLAVESGNVQAIQLLLQAGAQVNVTNVSLSTPLHIAAHLGAEEIVQILLSHGADMYRQDNTGRNSFHLAVTTGNIRLIQHFLSATETSPHIVQTVDSHQWTPLMCACASNHPSTCALLLSNHADLSARNDRGMTAVHIAAFLGSVPVLHELLSSSSSTDESILHALNQGDQRNQTPLFYACIEGHLDFALTLLRAGANAYHLDSDHQTCLHAMLTSSIILKRHIYLFYQLVQFVDFRFQEDALGRTLLDLAYVNRYQTIIQLLNFLQYHKNPTLALESRATSRLMKRDVLSLRQTCVLNFKRSIVYQQDERQATQRELLRSALQEIFQLDRFPPAETSDSTSTVSLPNKSFDDLSLLQQHQQSQSPKYQKNVKATKNPEKKLRKTTSTFPTLTSAVSTGTSSASAEKSSSQVDLQQTSATRSVFGTLFKGQRLLASTISTSPSPSDKQPSPPVANPLAPWARSLVTHPAKLEKILDFPSLHHSRLLKKDIQLSIQTYKLLGTDAADQA